MANAFANAATEANARGSAIALPVHSYKRSGPGCSKLTSLLVNVSLKFQTLLSQICQYFLLKKCAKASLIFSTKNISVIGYKVVKHLTVDLLTSSLS